MKDPAEDVEALRCLLVAYVEDQISDEGRAWIEERIADDEALQEELLAVRAVRGRLDHPFAAEPREPELSPERRDALREAMASSRPSWWRRLWPESWLERP
jgi:anti-sigma factor RsiW